MIMKTARKVGLKKKVNSHIFIHSRATNLVNKLTEAQMKEYFGGAGFKDGVDIRPSERKGHRQCNTDAL